MMILIWYIFRKNRGFLNFETEFLRNKTYLVITLLTTKRLYHSLPWEDGTRKSFDPKAIKVGALTLST